MFKSEHPCDILIPYFSKYFLFLQLWYYGPVELKNETYGVNAYCSIISFVAQADSKHSLRFASNRIIALKAIRARTVN